jgi:MFS family permease
LISRLLISALVLALGFGIVILEEEGFAGPQFISAFFGIGLSLATILAGYLMNRWAFGRSRRVFMGVVVGGMIGRLVVVSLILVWVTLNLRIPLLTFFVSLSISYLTFQIIEAWSIHRGLQKGKI